jgi:hypothetical protein
MAKSPRFVENSEWPKFKNSCARFMRGIDQDGTFKCENATHLFPENNSKRDGFYAIPLIAMFISLGFESLESLNSIKHGIGEVKVEKIFYHLRSTQKDRDVILFDVMKNWSKCPPILRDQFIKYNPSKHFLNVPYNPDIRNIEDESEMESGYSNDTPVNLTEWDIAFAKFILQYMVEYIGYSNYDDIKGTFVLQQSSKHFIFKGKIQKLNGSQFASHTELIKQYARENKSLFDLNVNKIYFDRYVDVLRKILILFPFEENVLSEYAHEELSKSNRSVVNTHQEVTPKINPYQSTVPIALEKTATKFLPPSDNVNIQSLNKDVTEDHTRKLQLTPLEQRLIDVLVESITLDRSQKQMLIDTLKNPTALMYFLEKL